MKKSLLSLLLIFSFWMSRAQCLPPSNVSAYPGQISVEILFAPVQENFGFDIYICPAGEPAPNEGTQPTSSYIGSPAYFLGLNCNTLYQYYIRSQCEAMVTSPWTGPFAFWTQPCTTFNQPQNMSACPVNGEACFDLHQNDEVILGGGFPEGFYDLHYYGNFQDLENSANELDEACVSSGSQMIYAFAQDNFTMDSNVLVFQITALSNICNGLKLNAFLDGNDNGIKDSGENNFPYGQFSYELNDDGNPHFVASSTATQNLYDNNPGNSYDLGFAVDAPYNAFFSAPIAAYANINPPASGFSNHDFPIVSVASYRDVAISLISYSLARPGFEYIMAIKYTNMGNQPESGIITFAMPPGLIFGAANPSAGGSVTTTATGFTYNFVNLPAFQTETILINLSVATIPTVSIGQLLQMSASVSSSDADAIASNDISTLVQQVTASHDPNDKMEAHGPEIDIDSFTSQDYLTYTIRFENTGNADALNIKVTDLLDGQLDASTVRMVSSSHDVIMDRAGANIIWRFNSINLPPVSDSDPLQGHGYLTFQVKPMPGFGAGDIIPNGAQIYFDLNPAIVTNTFETHFVETLGTNAFQNTASGVYPNPANDKLTVISDANIQAVAIFDVSGKQIQAAQFQKLRSAVVDVSGLQAGIYFVRITTSSGSATQKLIKK
jgi:uncharacterized repeat protein (TIGR01451 family)